MTFSSALRERPAPGHRVARRADPELGERTWVLLTESPEGGWGLNGHANSGADIAAAARAELTAIAAERSAHE